MKIEAGKSLIHGTGLFSRQDIELAKSLQAYETTKVRMEDKNTARLLSGEILKAYRQFGYEPHILPSCSLQKRLAGILALFNPSP